MLPAGMIRVEPTQQRLAVLLYHHVGTSSSSSWPLLSVSPQRFASHIRWLIRAGYQPVTLRQWLLWHRDGASLPQRPVLLTFDDAYADAATHAFPILESFGITAGVFIVTRRIGQTSTWDLNAGFEPRALMNAHQIEFWARRGFEFAPHSRTHVDLTTVSTDAIDEEAGGSAEDMQALLGTSPSCFAYPYGHVNEHVLSRVAKHFERAFVVQVGPGRNDRHTPPLLLRRSLVEPRDTALDVLCRARTGVSLRHWLAWADRRPD